MLSYYTRLSCYIIVLGYYATLLSYVIFCMDDKAQFSKDVPNRIVACACNLELFAYTPVRGLVVF